MKIIAADNLAREIKADRLVVGAIPNTDEHKAKATEFVTWLNNLGHASNYGGVWYELVTDDYRLSRGMEDLV